MFRLATTSRLAIALVVILVGGGRLPAQDTLRRELTEIAKGIATALKGLSHDSISIGEFTGPPQLAASGGPVIVKTLGEELAKAGLTVKRTAQVGVKGEYRDVNDKQTGLLAAEIKGTVTDRGGEVLFTFSRGVFGDTMVAGLFGATARLTPDADTKTRSKELEQALDKPQVATQGTLIQTAPNAPYAIEILVAPHSGGTYVARAANKEDGLAFVPIQRGEVVAVRVHNRTSHEAAVSVKLDGINMYAFSKVKDPKTGQPLYTQVVIDPHKAATIKGWHIDNKVSEEFVITEYAKSAAAELRSSAPTGTITVSFAAAWPVNGKPPADEPANPNEFSRSADAVGRGKPVDSKFEEVQRNFGVVRETISVRYTK